MTDPDTLGGVSAGNGRESSNGEPSPCQSPTNTVECALVELLVQEASESLSDRLGKRHQPPWNPHQQVRIGVLPPRYMAPEAELDDSNEASALPRGAAAATEAVTAIGLDFLADVPSEAESIKLKLSVRFALYQPLLPTLSEMRHHAMGTAQRENRANDNSSSPPSRIPVPNAWQRATVFADELTIAIPLDGEHVRGPVDKLDAAIREAVLDHFARSDAAIPFRQQARTVPHSALSDEDSWQGAIQSRTDDAWSPVLPIPFLEAFAERLPDGKVLVSVSLTNNTIVTRGEFQDHTLYDCRIHAEAEGKATLVPQRFHLAPDDYRYGDLV